MAGERSYQAYLVRLWTVAEDSGVVWRVLVEDAHTGERQAFADLAGLYAFLREATGAHADERYEPPTAVTADRKEI